MIKPILRFLHKRFKAQYASILYEDAKRPKDFDNMEHCFVDSIGVNYYTWPIKEQVPGLRFSKAESLHVQILAGISHIEWGQFITDMRKAINRQAEGAFIPDIARIAVLIEEMDKRATIGMYPDLMYELIATLYVREDENPLDIEDIMLAKKVAQFKKDSRSGVYDFFAKGHIQRYLTSLTMPEKEWMERWNQAELTLKSMSKFLSLSTKELDQVLKSGGVSSQP